MMRGLGFTPLLGLLCACSVASVTDAPNTIAYNECQSSADCGAQGECVDSGSSTRPGLQCRSTRSAAFQKILFEVTSPADNSAVAGIQYLIPIEDVTAGGDPVQLLLQPISQVVGEVKTSEENWKCTPQFVNEVGGTQSLAMSGDSSLPARVSLIPTPTALGVYSPPAVDQADLVNMSYWGFSLNVPPGQYDIYVEPKPQLGDSCPVPPQLLRANNIRPGVTRLGIDLPEPSMFEFHVAWPAANGALDGWMVDMLEPASARVISTRVPLTLAKGSKTDYLATLAYSAVTVDGKPTPPRQEQLVRLSPPADAPASAALPTVMLARSALALFDSGRGTLTSFTSLPTPVHVIGQVTSGDRPTPVPATVTLVANSIPGIAPGVLASLVRTVSVGIDGQFEVYLLPGKYTVSTVPESALDPSRPDENALAADAREWIVPSSPLEQAGKVIDLSNALPITGNAVFDYSGRAAATAPVQAVASPLSTQYDPLQETLGGTATLPHPAFVPRASIGDLSDRGDFALRADPGTFDISVRPNFDTGFGWLVLPNVPVTKLGSGAFLGQIEMTLPFSYGGTVTVRGADGLDNRIPSALIRAYIYLKDGDYTTDAANADSVVQVAETRADNQGVFNVLIPAELNHLR